MSKQIAVCISDIHFNLQNLELASSALESALEHAKLLNIPLIIAGDLQDTKAIIRAEIANRLISIFSSYPTVQTYLLVGNHDLVNEKGSIHALNYLRPYLNIIDFKVWIPDLFPNVLFIPYHSDNEDLTKFLKEITPGTIVIMHQGFIGAAMGDYIQDKTSVDPEDVKHLTVISGHYHRHQTIGTVTYIGSPYTISFGEANDGDKGFIVLNDDGTFTRVILGLRAHCIFNLSLDNLSTSILPSDQDLVWVKLSGSYSELQKVNKKDLGENLLGHSNFRLELIPTDSKEIEQPKELMTDTQILDTIIDAESESDKQKQYLKELYNEIIDS